MFQAGMDGRLQPYAYMCFVLFARIIGNDSVLFKSSNTYSVPPPIPSTTHKPTVLSIHYYSNTCAECIFYVFCEYMRDRYWCMLSGNGRMGENRKKTMCPLTLTPIESMFYSSRTYWTVPESPPLPTSAMKTCSNQLDPLSLW